MQSDHDEKDYNSVGTTDAGRCPFLSALGQIVKIVKMAVMIAQIGQGILSKATSTYIYHS